MNHLDLLKCTDYKQLLISRGISCFIKTKVNIDFIFNLLLGSLVSVLVCTHTHTHACRLSWCSLAKKQIIQAITHKWLPGLSQFSLLIEPSKVIFKKTFWWLYSCLSVLLSETLCTLNQDGSFHIPEALFQSNELCKSIYVKLWINSIDLVMILCGWSFGFIFCSCVPVYH